MQGQVRQGALVALARDFGGFGVRVNAVRPGVIKTPMHAPETHEFLAALHPMGRMGEAEEVANTIAFLASDAASYITGTCIHVDGGVSGVL